MTPELTVLALAGLLEGFQFVLMSVPANLELGPGKTASPRDPERLGKPVQDLLSVRTGRPIARQEKVLATKMEQWRPMRGNVI